MKKMFFALLLITTVSQAQYRFRYDKLFMEAGVGLAVPLTQLSPSGENRPLSLVHGQGGFRYMFSENVGVMGALSFDQFNKGIQKSDQLVGSLELCYNLGNAIDLSRATGGQFGLLVHAGAGAGVMSSQYFNRDKIGVLMVGARPYIFINEKVSFFADLTYKSTLSQKIYYDGNLIGKEVTGSNIGLTFGFMVALGQNRFHADSAY
ncbi:hypothetical protein [Flavobacterium hydrophilum]|uniref:Outer membrane protein beta-barrel domain-containing protein n=1 Tax=Flavobacterium hydrophilum TaxID=2211445 RepID=A0A2V4C4U0_9FLAO|nr:hypothetical protein [Flavobacterium hydrophilum]PXY45692.1 hypothetical protein DMB68_00415 [Flavobacterium hydrophilum]